MKLKGRKIYKGTAEGEAIVTKDGISFYGGVDPDTGKVVEVGHELEGQSITGKVLVFPTGKGSTVGSYTMYRMKKNNMAPIAIINKEIDTIIAVGCIISEIPCVDKIDISNITTGQLISVNGSEGTVEVKVMGKGSGFGKTIVFGEHFVVYGFPAIASALGTSTIAEVKIVDGKGWTVDDQRPATPGYKKKKYDDAMQSITNVIEYLKIDIESQKLELTFAGDLIAASGVGASAAQCTSLARALNDTFDLNLDDEKINEAAYEGEKAYHGTPSGIDNTASTYGGLIYFVKNLSGGKNTMDLLQSPKNMPLVIGNTGLTSSTTEVVADVRRLKEENPKKFDQIFNNYKKLAIEAKKALLEGNINEIANLMNQNHKLLQEITVSSEVNDNLVDIALKNGAIGAKMTGTGRGGLVIALTENEAIQEKVAIAIEKEGYDAWKTMIG